MRALRIGFLLLLVAAPAAAASVRSSPECSAGAAPQLPAALTITAGPSAYRVLPNGDVCRLARVPASVPQGVDWWPATYVWTRDVRGRLVVGRRHRTLWRSRGRLLTRRNAYDLSVAVGSHGIAFSLGFPKRRLYVARPGGSADPVARAEYPIGWTRGGFYAWGPAHERLLLRAPDGRFRALVAATVRTYAYGDGSLWLLEGDRLLQATGARVREVVSLAALGLSSAHVQIQPLRTLVALQTADRLVVLRRDGSIFASTSLPRSSSRVDSVSAEPVEAGSGTAVAFAATRGDRANGSRGTESVYVLSADATTARLLHTERVHFAVCERGSGLAWRGDWLLYQASEGNSALVDVASRGAVELTGLVRRLARPYASNEGDLNFQLSWARRVR